jgi:hypothetical protein
MATDFLRDVGDEVLGMIGLGEVVVDPEGGEGTLMVAEDGRATDHDPLVGAGALDPPADLDAREDRQVQVEKDEIKGARLVEATDALRAVTGLDYLVTLVAEELGDQGAEPMLVLDQKQVSQPIGLHRLLLETSRQGAVSIPDGEPSALDRRIS